MPSQAIRLKNKPKPNFLQVPSGQKCSSLMHYLKVATFNVWFGDFQLHARALALCELLANEDLDIIGLQEVTPAFWEVLCKQGWTESYSFSITSSDDFSNYSNLLLSRIPQSEFEQTRLWSYQDRHIDVLRLNQGLSIGTVHLESRRQNGEIRCTQLSDIFSNLSPTLSLLMGDFNFDDGSQEEDMRPANFIDAWTQLHRADLGPTLDTRTNFMLRAHSQREKRARFDRIWFDKKVWRVLDIRRIGTEFIAGQSETWPSDHFGLTASLVLLSADDQEEPP